MMGQEGHNTPKQATSNNRHDNDTSDNYSGPSTAMQLSPSAGTTPNREGNSPASSQLQVGSVSNNLVGRFPY